MSNKKKILVTGSEGYIGKHLCYLLKQQKNIELYQLDINANIDSSPKDLIYANNINSNLGFICHPQLKKLTLQGFDAVVHLAALVRIGEAVKMPYQYYETNINGSLNVIHNLDYDHFIFASTATVPGMSNPYSISKKVIEDIIMARDNMKYTILRFHNVTGTNGFPATNPDGLFYNLTKAIKTGELNLYGTDYDTRDGTALRDYIHVMDICHSILNCIKANTGDKEIQHLTYAEPLTVREVITAFKKVNYVDFKINECPRRPGDLGGCEIDTPSHYLNRNYTTEQLFKI